MRVTPQQSAVIRVNADWAFVHERDELILPVHFNQDRRSVGEFEIVLLPHNRAVFLIEGDERRPRRADRHDHRVFPGDGRDGVAARALKALQVGIEIMLPNDLAGLLFQTMELAGCANGKDPITRNDRRRARPRPLFQIVLFGVGERRVVGIFPQRLSRFGGQRNHDILLAFAIHRVEHVFFDRDRRIAIAQIAAPQLARAGFRPGRGKPLRLDFEVAVRPAPLRPIGRGLRPSGQGETAQPTDGKQNSLHCFSCGFSNSFASTLSLSVIASMTNDWSFHGCPSKVALIWNGNVTPSTARKSEKVWTNSPNVPCGPRRLYDKLNKRPLAASMLSVVGTPGSSIITCSTAVSPTLPAPR